MHAFFLFRDGAPTPLLVGTHDPGLVGLAIFVAPLSAVLALPLARSAIGTQGLAQRELPLAAAAVAFGGGVWAMHFIAMLAFELCTPVRYAVLPTLLSILPAVLATRAAFGLISRAQVSTAQIHLAGSLLAAGIGLMHFTGMAAMRMAPLLRYDLAWFVATLVLAALFSTLGLWLEVRLRDGARLPRPLALLLSGCVTGGAICIAHFVGMASARFLGEADPAYVPGSGGQFGMAMAVAAVVIGGVLVVAGVHTLTRYRALVRRAHDDEARMRAIVDTAVDAILTADADGRIQSFNRGAERLFG